MKSDAWIIGFAVTLIMILARPTAIWGSVSEKLGIYDYQTTKAIAAQFPTNSAELNFWRQVKGEEPKIVLGSLPEIGDLFQTKLLSRGLAIDETGEVVPKEELGKLKPPFKFLIIGGSSMLEGLGPQLERDLSTLPKSTIIRFGRYSTGLNRIDYFDWYSQSKQLLAQHKPHAVITQFGGNDGQAITDSKGRVHPLASAGWDVVYKKRVVDFMRLFSKVKKLYWLELPIARTSDFTNKFIRMNKIQREAAAQFDNVVYVKTWDRFAPNGRYEHILPDDSGKRAVVKQPDGVHLTLHGSRIMSSIFMKYVKRDVFIPKE